MLIILTCLLYLHRGKKVVPFKNSRTFQVVRDAGTLQNGYLKGSETFDCGWLKVFGFTHHFLSGVFSLEVSPFFFFTCRDLCLALSGVDGSCFSVGSFFTRMLL